MFKPIIVALTFVVLSATTHAQVTIIPPDLAPDTSYRLVFVTSTEGLSQSSDLSTYDAIVQAAADANPALDGINWQVIGSTDTVDAEAHTSTNPADPFVIPIFRLDGVNVANDYADLWDSSINSPINIDEFGDTLDVEVWTGTAPNGTNNNGSFGLGTSSIPGPRFGRSSDSGDGWIVAGVNNYIFDRHYYAISEILRTPGFGPPPLLGDVNRNGVVDFADIPPFIQLLIVNEYQIEADINLSLTVDFADIPGFIDILIAR